MFAKKDVINATKLCHFNPKKQFILTDASKNGLSAMLMQVNNGVETTVAHASKTLSIAQNVFLLIEKKAPAIIFGVKKIFINIYSIWAKMFICN